MIAADRVRAFVVAYKKAVHSVHGTTTIMSSWYDEWHSLTVADLEELVESPKKVYALVEFRDTHDAHVEDMVLVSIHSTPESAMAAITVEHPNTIIGWDHHDSHGEQWDATFDATEYRYEYSIIAHKVLP